MRRQPREIEMTEQTKPTCHKQLLFSAVVLLLTASSLTVAQSHKYKVGDRVECDYTQTGNFDKGTVVAFEKTDLDQSGRWRRVKIHKDTALEAKNRGGSWLPAKIITVEGAFYKVRFESRDSRHDETVDEDRVRPFGTSEQEAENQNKQDETRNSTPKMAGAFPSLPGTAWKIDFGRGVTGTVFLFCKSGRWEIVPARAGSIGAVGKSYSVSGSTLTTVNRDDGMVQKYRMTWKGGVLELFDGKVTLGLHYNGETQCK
jgi:hypothetical protein